MLFTIAFGTVLESFLLLLNAMAIINEKRVLRKCCLTRRLAPA